MTDVGSQLGYDVMNKLLKYDHEGVGFNIQENYNGVADGFAVTKVLYVTLDITDKDAVERVITEVNSDAVIHWEQRLPWTWQRMTIRWRKSVTLIQVEHRILRMFVRRWTVR